MRTVLVWMAFLQFVAIFCSTSAIGLSSTVLLLLGFWHFRDEVKKLPESPLFWPLVSFSGVVVLSIALADRYDFEKPLGKLRYYWLFFPLFWLFQRESRLVKGVERLGVWIGIGLGVLAVFQTLGFVPGMWFVRHSGESLFHARGLVFHHVPFAYNCLLLFHLLLGLSLARGWEKTGWPHRLSLVALVVAIACSFSRGSWVALVGSLALLSLLSGRLFARVGIAVVLAFALGMLTSAPLRNRVADLNPTKNQDRLILWDMSVRMFQDSPLIGQGFHGFKDHRQKYLTPEAKALPQLPIDPHSVWFDLLGGTGILGLAAFLWLGLSMLRMALRGLYAPGMGAEVRGRLLGCLGALFSFAIAGCFDTHSAITYTLNGTIFFWAFGLSAALTEPSYAKRTPTMIPCATQ